MNAVLLIVIMSAATTDGLSQGRGRDNSHDRKHGHRHDSRNDERTRITYIPGDRFCNTPVHRHGPPAWAPSHGYHAKTRYIYYRDYDVYYDCHSRTFISFTGRNWVVSYEVPACMRRCDFDRVAYVGVDYFDDDLPRYIERRRPAVLVNIGAQF